MSSGPTLRNVATWDDVRSIALDLPGAVEDRSGSTIAWRVGSKAFAWERVLRRGERELLGDRAPDGPALGLRTAEAESVDALVAARPGVFFTIAGYGIHPMVLLHVERATYEDLDEAITDAWMARASKRAVAGFLAGPRCDRRPGAVDSGAVPQRARGASGGAKGRGTDR